MESKHQSNEHNQAGTNDFQCLFGHFEYVGYLLHGIAFFCVLSLFNPVWLFVTLWDCSQPGSSVHGDSPECLSGLPCPPPGGSSWTRDRTHVSFISSMGGRFFIIGATWEADIILIVLNVLIWSLSTSTGLSDNGASSSENGTSQTTFDEFSQSKDLLHILLWSIFVFVLFLSFSK